jgi:prophage regulatory protein
LKLLSFNELRPKKGIPYTRQHLARLENAGRFPKRVKFPGGNRVGWIEEEIDAMQAAMAAARDPLPPSPEPIPAGPKIISIASGKRKGRATNRAGADEPPAP